MAGFTAAKSLVVQTLDSCGAQHAQGELHRVGKAVQPLQSVKNYSNSRVHGHGRTWLGHTKVDWLLAAKNWF